jgi:hypothetical protein
MATEPKAIFEIANLMVSVALAFDRIHWEDC